MGGEWSVLCGRCDIATCRQISDCGPSSRLIWRLEEIGDLGGDSKTNLAVCIDFTDLYVIFASDSGPHVKDHVNLSNKRSEMLRMRDSLRSGGTALAAIWGSPN